MTQNAECRCDCVNCVTGQHDDCYYRPSLCPWLDELARLTSALTALAATWQERAAQIRRSAVEPAIGHVLAKCAAELDALVEQGTPDPARVQSGDGAPAIGSALESSSPPTPLTGGGS